ncbi:hypothetical protein EC973_006171 [Apophysomyces ossiformis]|uniref:GP-PDE domain-containing protein n=1 Tax=Apophysomyces ossiformis TaxID=679940 RepID=A0A8H7ERS3_9FUNG|nr:hypothetical protein EC973_006171 [Apophysomyces ossiformis]
MTISNSPVGKVSVPDVVAHRGFSARYPENTMQAYRKAVEAGTTGLEGDIRLTKDGEVIMMHDLTLDRTTTGSGPIKDHNWHGDIENLVTKKGQQPVPRFIEVLELLISNEVDDNMYMVVDIKFDNPLKILDALHELFQHESIQPHIPTLKKRLIIGIWDSTFLARSKELFEGFRFCFIGLSLEAARTNYLYSCDAVSLHFAILASSEGQAYIKEAHALQKRVFCWTINKVEQMETCVAWGVDAVIGDNIPLLLEHVHENIKHLTYEEFAMFVKSCKYPGILGRLHYRITQFIMQCVSSLYIGA